MHGSEANISLPSVRSITSPLLLKPLSFKNAASPGIAGVVVRGMELSQLLPREVWNAQGVTSGDHSIRVVRQESVLKMLGEYPLIICLQVKRDIQTHNVTYTLLWNSKSAPFWECTLYHFASKIVPNIKADGHTDAV